MSIEAIKAIKMVYANTTKHDWPDDIWEAICQAIAEAENQYAAKAAELAHLSDRIQIDPKTGNVSIGSKEAIAEAEKQEPVAQCMEHGECFGGKCIYYRQNQKHWVALTEKEKEEIQKVSTCYEQAVELTEAKLKEKNT